MPPGRARREPPPRPTVLAPLLGLGLAAALFTLGPAALDASYDWVRHTTSEAAGQGVRGAWLTRAAFLCFGGSVLLLVAVSEHHPAVTRWIHRVFGVGMVAVASFASRPWDRDAPFDETEDLLHSIAATTVGFAFAIGVAAMAIDSRVRQQDRDWFDWLAVGASVVLPLGMWRSPHLAGALQRLMFGIALLWFGREAFGTLDPVRHSGRRSG